MVCRQGILFLSILLSSCSFASLVDIEPYREAQLIKSTSKKNEVVEIPLSQIRRAGSGWEPESVVRIEGDYFSSLYKISRNAVLSDVYAYYRSALLAGGKSILFECDSRSCGSSNAWANNFFKEYLLNGGDQNQFLFVVKGEDDFYQVMYLNRRGAGDVMVRLDEVKSIEPKNLEFEIVAQLDVSDVPRIRRFLTDLPEGQSVIGLITSDSNGPLSALESGDQLISIISTGLGERLRQKVRFLNLANFGQESLGIERISFIYSRP